MNQINFPTYSYMDIEPKNKTQVSQLNGYRKVLNITLPQEDFVLKCILSFDWNRKCILQKIINIKKAKHLDMIDFRIYVTAPNHIVDYSCGNPLDGNLCGWDLKLEKDRYWYTYFKLESYITR